MKAIASGVRILLCVGVLAGLCWTIGCGPSGPQTGSVSGKVTLQGQPLATGVVVFSNPAQGAGGSAPLDASGSYQIKDLRVGDYEVAIQPPPPPAPHEMQKTPPPAANIPAKFQDPKNSGLKATIKKGQNTADFTLTP